MNKNKNIKQLNMEEIKQTIWNSVIELKTARKQLDWSIAELSKISGVSVGVISDLENNRGKVPSLANFIALTRALGMSDEFVLNTVLGASLDKNKNNEKLLTDVLHHLGVSDIESLTYVIDTINFVRKRKKNKDLASMPDIDNNPAILKELYPYI